MQEGSCKRGSSLEVDHVLAVVRISHKPPPASPISHRRLLPEADEVHHRKARRSTITSNGGHADPNVALLQKSNRNGAWPLVVAVWPRRRVSRRLQRGTASNTKSFRIGQFAEGAYLQASQPMQSLDRRSYRMNPGQHAPRVGKEEDR